MDIQKIKKSDIKFEYIQNGGSLVLKLFKIKNTSFEYEEQESLYSTFYTLLTTKEFTEEDDYYIYGIFNEDNGFINFITYEQYDELNDLFKKFRVFLSIFLHNNEDEFPIQQEITNKIEFPKKLYNLEEFESLIFNYVSELNNYKDNFNTIFDDLDLVTDDFVNRYMTLQSDFKLQVQNNKTLLSTFRLSDTKDIILTSEYSLWKES